MMLVFKAGWEEGVVLTVDVGREARRHEAEEEKQASR